MLPGLWLGSMCMPFEDDTRKPGNPANRELDKLRCDRLQFLSFCVTGDDQKQGAFCRIG